MPAFELRRHASFRSRFLPDRDLLVALPPGYAAGPTRRYPVLYMQDGQNLFGDDASPLSGEGWRLDLTAGGLIANGTIAPLIVVGIPNMAGERAAEYTLTYNEQRQTCGKAALYGRMLVEEIKPRSSIRSIGRCLERTTRALGGRHLVRS